MRPEIIRVDSAEAWDIMQREIPENAWEVIQRALRNSTRIWLGLIDQRPVAMWGLIPPTLMSDTAYLWLQTTSHLQSHQLVFIRHSQRSVRSMLTEYSEIVGHCHVDNTKAQQWLRWLGAEFGPAEGDHLPFIIKASQSWQPDSVQSA